MKFSISVPIGKYHPFLPQCLASLAEQEVPLSVALLDASGDSRVQALAQEYASLITYARHGPDKGQSDAIIEGWRNTDGDVLGWLNADDVLFPGALATVLARFQSDECPDVVYGGSTIVDERDSFIGFHWGVEPPSDRLYETMNIAQPSCFFKRAIHDAAGGLNEDLHYVMDWDLFIRIRLEGARFSYIDEFFSKVLWADDTKTSSFGGGRSDELKALIAKYAPKDRQAKVFRSFAVHHFLDNVKPSFLQHVVRRAVVRGRQSVNGLSADGTIAEDARLPLLFYGAERKSAIRLFFRSPAAVSDVAIAGIECDKRDAPGGFVLAPKAPFAPAQVIDLQIRTAPGSKASFQRCEWVD